MDMFSFEPSSLDHFSLNNKPKSKEQSKLMSLRQAKQQAGKSQKKGSKKGANKTNKMATSASSTAINTDNTTDTGDHSGETSNLSNNAGNNTDPKSNNKSNNASGPMSFLANVFLGDDAMAGDYTAENNYVEEDKKEDEYNDAGPAVQAMGDPAQGESAVMMTLKTGEDGKCSKP